MNDEYLEDHPSVAVSIALYKEVNRQIQKFIQKIEDAKPPARDDYTQGVQDGLDWAIRILMKDKSAS